MYRRKCTSSFALSTQTNSPSGDLPSAVSTSTSSSSSPLSPAAPKTLVTSYILNDRLFPVPVHQSTASQLPTQCPVCEDFRKRERSPRRYVR